MKRLVLDVQKKGRMEGLTHNKSDDNVRVYLVYFSATWRRGVWRQIWPAIKGMITTPPKLVNVEEVDEKNKSKSVLVMCDDYVSE